MRYFPATDLSRQVPRRHEVVSIGANAEISSNDRRVRRSNIYHTKPSNYRTDALERPIHISTPWRYRDTMLSKFGIGVCRAALCCYHINLQHHHNNRGCRKRHQARKRFQTPGILLRFRSLPFGPCRQGGASTLSYLWWMDQLHQLCSKRLYLITGAFDLCVWRQIQTNGYQFAFTRPLGQRNALLLRCLQ